MAKLMASTFIASGELWLYLDNKLILQNSDSATVELEEDTMYILHWFVKGAPEGSYSITISSPWEVKYQLTRVVGNGGKNNNSIYFSA